MPLNMMFYPDVLIGRVYNTSEPIRTKGQKINTGRKSILLVLCPAVAFVTLGARV